MLMNSYIIIKIALRKSNNSCLYGEVFKEYNVFSL